MVSDHGPRRPFIVNYSTQNNSETSEPMEPVEDGQKKERMDIAASREKRINRVKAKQRDRGGIFKPAETNPLIDILLARDVSGISPRKAQKKKPRRSSPRKSEVKAQGRRKSKVNEDSLAVETLAQERSDPPKVSKPKATPQKRQIKASEDANISKEAGPSKSKEALTDADRAPKGKRKSLVPTALKRQREMPEGSNEKERAKATKNNIEPPAKRSKKDPTLTKVPNTPKPQPTTTAPDSRTEAGDLGTSPTRKGKEPEVTITTDPEPESASASLRLRAKAERRDKAKLAKEKGSAKRTERGKKDSGKGKRSKTSSPGPEPALEPEQEDNYRTKSSKPSLETVTEESEEKEEVESQSKKASGSKNVNDIKVPEEVHASDNDEGTQKKRKRAHDEDPGDHELKDSKPTKRTGVKKARAVQDKDEETSKQTKKTTGKPRKKKTDKLSPHPESPLEPLQETEPEKKPSRKRKPATPKNVATASSTSKKKKNAELPISASSNKTSSTIISGRKLEYKAPKSGPKPSIKWPAPPIVAENMALLSSRTPTKSTNFALLRSPLKAAADSDDEIDCLS